MIIVKNGIILGQSGGGGYSNFLPWHHDSGVERWVIDELTYTHEVEGHKVRLRSQAEIELEPRYQAWVKKSWLDAAQVQAQIDFSTVPQWIKTGTANQGESWIEDNVTSIATAKIALKNLVRIIIYLRDYIKLSE